MDLASLEGEARSVYVSAGFALDAPCSMASLAKAVLGRPVEVVHARALPGDACLATVNSEKRIFLRRGLSKERARFAVAHELAHLALGLDSSTLENEDTCSTMAACLVVPRRAFQVVLAETVLFRELAARFTTSESCVALRYGEVTGTPLALVTPQRVRVRGEEWCWPEEVRLRSGDVDGTLSSLSIGKRRMLVIATIPIGSGAQASAVGCRQHE